MPPIDALQKIQTDLIRKSTNGSVFVASSTAAAINETTLFDSTTGDLAAAGLPAGYTDLGYLTDAGAQFARAITESNLASWQSITPTRSDTTADVTTLQIEAQETKLETIGVYTGVDPAAVTPAANGVIRINKPVTPVNRRYRVLAIAVDEQDIGEIVVARFLPNAKPTAFGDQHYDKSDAAIMWPVTFTGYVDDVLGTAESYLFGGAGWSALLSSMGIARTVTCSTTSANATLTATTGRFYVGDVGKKVSGAGIPANTTITAFTDATHVTMSNPATATATGVAVTVGG